MSTIKNMFSEVQYELVKLILLDVFLSTVIVFLIADLISLIFNMPIWYVILLSTLYFITVLALEVRKITVKQVEKNNPELQEILRTAKDNMQSDSLMAHALFHDVMEKMRRVSSGSFLDFKKLTMKLSSIFVLAIVLIAIAFFNINLAKFDNPLDKPLSAIGSFFGGSGGEVEGQTAAGTTDDIFGDPRMAKLGDDSLVATVNPSLDNPDFNNLDPSNPSSDPLEDLGEGTPGFTAGGLQNPDGLDQRDLERSYEYSKSIQR